ncbi:hypothetical protein OAG48_00540 [bacterium]|nr:hypothetical protein [bacterium]
MSDLKETIRNLAAASALVIFFAGCGSTERKSTAEEAASPAESEVTASSEPSGSEGDGDSVSEAVVTTEDATSEEADSGADSADDASGENSDAAADRAAADEAAAEQAAAEKAAADKAAAERKAAAEAAAEKRAAARKAAAERAAEERAAAEQAAAEQAAAEQAAAEQAAAEQAAAEQAAAELAATKKAAAAEAAAAKAAAERAAEEARRPRSFSFEIDSPEAASIQEFFDRGCARMGDWVVEPPDAMIVHLEKEISAAVASNKAFSGCTASYLVLAHDDLEILPVCQNGGKAFMVAVDDAIPHVYLLGASGRVSDDSVLRDDRRHRLADELWFNANAKGPTGRSLRPGDRLLVWDRWDNSRDWNGWVIVLED